MGRRRRAGRPLTPPLRATYRLQLHAGFPFGAAARVVPYLARLGISHVYCSPILQAAPGSTHGYDVVDPTRLSDDLGGPTGFGQLTSALAEHEMAMVLDIVPNHMALAGPANRWWWDLLEDGPHSRWAAAFDIDWTPALGSPGPSVLMPVLGDHYGRVLEAGELGLRRRGAEFAVTYADHELPLALPTLAPLLHEVAAGLAVGDLERVAGGVEALTAVDDLEARHHEREQVRLDLRNLTVERPEVADAIDAALARVAADPDALDGLLARQSYRLAHWRTASQELDYRRFFDVTDLVGVRVEDPWVFDEVHRAVIDLASSDAVAALRIDHIDGLRDPAAYLERLGREVPDTALLVEKVLAVDEVLPPSWPVAGTTGYDFLRVVNDLFVDPGGAARLDADAAAHVDPTPYADSAYEARVRVASVELATEVEQVVDLLAEVCLHRRRHRDHTRRDLRAALRTLLASFPVYRTYVAPGSGASPADRQHVAAGIAAARDRRPDLDVELLDLLARVLLLEEPGDAETDLALRFQQLSGPVMAKGVEDTAFYRHVPVLARNEVGCDPGQPPGGTPAFHAHNQRMAATHPATMVTLSTHDTKRSADVRARLLVLTELAAPWLEAVAGWRATNDRHWHGAIPDRRSELVLYQTLAGAWPVEPSRVQATVLKSLREAKLQTSWRDPDLEHEAIVQRFTEGVLADPHGMASIEAFLVEHGVVGHGRTTSLAQTALLLTSPGVPDLYQGDEVWNLRLVDPDNRGPVDHAAHAALLDALDVAPPVDPPGHAEAGGPKLWLVHRLLQHRRECPDRYADGDYRALVATGPLAEHVVAFARAGLVTVAPRLVTGVARGWKGTAIALPEGTWTDVVSGTAGWSGEVGLDDLLGAFPVAVLDRAG